MSPWDLRCSKEWEQGLELAVNAAARRGDTDALFLFNLLHVDVLFVLHLAKH